MSFSHNRVQDVVAFNVSFDLDKSVHFQVISDSVAGAKIEALEKIGYSVIEDGGHFRLVDVDEPSLIESNLDAANLPAAYDLAFKIMCWTFSEPTELIGGQMGSGFGEMTEDN